MARALRTPEGTIAGASFEGTLHKLKSKAPVVGSAWNERWFKVEERGYRRRTELALAYYASEKASAPTDAKGWVFLRDVEHVGLVDDAGRLDLHVGEASLDARALAALTKSKELVFEVCVCVWGGGGGGGAGGGGGGARGARGGAARNGRAGARRCSPRARSSCCVRGMCGT